MERLIIWVLLIFFCGAALGIVLFANGIGAGHRADPFPKLREAQEARQEFEDQVLILENVLLATGRVDTLAKKAALTIASHHSDSSIMTDRVISLLGDAK